MDANTTTETEFLAIATFAGVGCEITLEQSDDVNYRICRDGVEVQVLPDGTSYRSAVLAAAAVVESDLY